MIPASGNRFSDEIVRGQELDDARPRRSEPVFAAPFVSSVMTIEPQWIDYNGHLNVAYYNVLFDRAVDEVYELIGLGPAYLERHQAFDHGGRSACAILARAEAGAIRCA